MVASKPTRGCQRGAAEPHTTYAEGISDPACHACDGVSSRMAGGTFYLTGRGIFPMPAGAGRFSGVVAAALNCMRTLHRTGRAFSFDAILQCPARCPHRACALPVVVSACDGCSSPFRQTEIVQHARPVSHSNDQGAERNLPASQPTRFRCIDIEFIP